MSMPVQRKALQVSAACKACKLSDQRTDNFSRAPSLCMSRTKSALPVAHWPPGWEEAMHGIEDFAGALSVPIGLLQGDCRAGQEEGAGALPVSIVTVSFAL